MKRNVHAKKNVSKGDRLNWPLINELKPVTLSQLATTGRFLTEQDLQQLNWGNTNSTNDMLIP